MRYITFSVLILVIVVTIGCEHAFEQTRGNDQYRSTDALAHDIQSVHARIRAIRGRFLQRLSVSQRSGFRYKRMAVVQSMRNQCMHISLPQTSKDIGVFARILRAKKLPIVNTCLNQQRSQTFQKYVQARSLFGQVQSIFRSNLDSCSLFQEMKQFRSSLKSALRCLKQNGVNNSFELRRWECYLDRSRFRILQIYAIRILSWYYLNYDILEFERIQRVLHHVQQLTSELSGFRSSTQKTALQKVQALIPRIQRLTRQLQARMFQHSSRMSQRHSHLLRIINDRVVDDDALRWYLGRLHMQGFQAPLRMRILPRAYCRYHIYRRAMSSRQRGLYCRFHGVVDCVKRQTFALKELQSAGCAMIHTAFLSQMTKAWHHFFLRLWTVRERSLLAARWLSQESRRMRTMQHHLVRISQSLGQRHVQGAQQGRSIQRQNSSKQLYYPGDL